MLSYIHMPLFYKHQTVENGKQSLCCWQRSSLQLVYFEICSWLSPAFILLGQGRMWIRQAASPRGLGTVCSWYSEELEAVKTSKSLENLTPSLKSHQNYKPIWTEVMF